MPSIRQPQFSRALQEQGLRRQLRRLADVLIACVLLAITFPLMITVAVAIKLESAGPVLERQERIGRGGRRIERLKFRTTVHDPKLATAAWTRKTTQLGEFLRHTRIDDLPQLINVLRGEITLAGLYAALLT
jgi:lipopolysaccharide/colanic/teichoic acid biosynthesis glycosyltransferase